MTTPQQLLDQLTQAERSATGPPAQTREQLWAKIQAQLDAGTMPEIDDAPLIDPVSSKPTLLAIVGALVLAGVIGGGLALALRDRSDPPSTDDAALAAGAASADEPTPKPAAAPPIVRETPVEPTVVEPTIDAPVEPNTDAPTPSPETETPASRPAPKPKPKPKPKPVAGKTLADELALMQALSTALKQGDSQRARKLVAEHERDFPSGQFIEERQAAKARAQCMSGKLDAGRKLAHGFAKRWPSSIHLAAVESDCELE